jgi:hypothetical protein
MMNLVTSVSADDLIVDLAKCNLIIPCNAMRRPYIQVHHMKLTENSAQLRSSEVETPSERKMKNPMLFDLVTVQLQVRLACLADSVSNRNSGPRKISAPHI